MQLEGFGIGGYRSFGNDVQYLAPLSKVNLLAGQNNTGKSNVLRFLHDLYRPLVGGAHSGSAHRLATSPLDAHRPRMPPLRFALGFQLGGPTYERMVSALGGGNAQRAFGEVVRALADTADTVWFPFVVSQGSEEVEPDPDWVAGPASGVDNNAWAVISNQVAGSTGRTDHNVRASVRAMSRYVDVPNVALIPAVRRIGTDAVTSDDFGGSDIVQRLASLQNPSALERDHKRPQFDAINDFVKTVTGIDDASIEIPYERDTVNVTFGGHMLPLENLGTGIHEVMMLAAWATVFENQVVCIEELELHLHPLLQRKLIRYLADRTSNQYVITTHSAHLLDEPGSSVFHVRSKDGQTSVVRTVAPAQRVELCADLGYRASDLVQANAIVWVEGPSDRLYLRHWLAQVDDDLIEGIHYSLMFYGGRLLSQLSASDVEVEDFISLRRINQWLSVVIDSDRHAVGDRINKTKKRVSAEFDKGPGFSWITSGREIENYLPDFLLDAAVAAVHPRAHRVVAGDGRFADVTRIKTKNGERQIDKVKVAHHVINEPADLSVLDLRRQMQRLVRFIRDANRL